MRQRRCKFSELFTAAQRSCNITSHHIQKLYSSRMFWGFFVHGNMDCHFKVMTFIILHIWHTEINATSEEHELEPPRSKLSAHSSPLHSFSSLQEVESSYMQGPPEVQARVQVAPPVATRHSPRLHTPSPPLQRRLPSQRSGHLNSGPVVAPPHPPNWCSSSQRSTVTPQQQQPLHSIPMHTPSQERGHAGSRELSQVSASSLSCFAAGKLCMIKIFTSV